MKYGALRIWWIPQVPGKPFDVDVESVAEGKKILAILADYDLFQFHQKIKPDYANAGGLSLYNRDSGWEDWECPDCGGDVDDCECDK